MRFLISRDSGAPGLRCSLGKRSEGPTEGTQQGWAQGALGRELPPWVGSMWRWRGRALCAHVIISYRLPPPPRPREHTHSWTQWLSPVLWRREQLWAFSIQCHSSWWVGRSEQGTCNVPESPWPRMTVEESPCTLWLQTKAILLFWEILDCLELDPL